MNPPDLPVLTFRIAKHQESEEMEDSQIEPLSEEFFQVSELLTNLLFELSWHDENSDGESLFLALVYIDSVANLIGLWEKAILKTLDYMHTITECNLLELGIHVVSDTAHGAASSILEDLHTPHFRFMEALILAENPEADRRCSPMDIDGLLAEADAPPLLYKWEKLNEKEREPFKTAESRIPNIPLQRLAIQVDHERKRCLSAMSRPEATSTETKSPQSFPRNWYPIIWKLQECFTRGQMSFSKSQLSSEMTSVEGFNNCMILLENMGIITAHNSLEESSGNEGDPTGSSISTDMREISPALLTHPTLESIQTVCPVFSKGATMTQWRQAFSKAGISYEVTAFRGLMNRLTNDGHTYRETEKGQYQVSWAYLNENKITPPNG